MTNSFTVLQDSAISPEVENYSTHYENLVFAYRLLMKQSAAVAETYSQIPDLLKERIETPNAPTLPQAYVEIVDADTAIKETESQLEECAPADLLCLENIKYYLLAELKFDETPSEITLQQIIQRVNESEKAKQIIDKILKLSKNRSKKNNNIAELDIAPYIESSNPNNPCTVLLTEEAQRLDLVFLRQQELENQLNAGKSAQLIAIARLNEQIKNETKRLKKIEKAIQEAQPKSDEIENIYSEMATKNQEANEALSKELQTINQQIAVAKANNQLIESYIAETMEWMSPHLPETISLSDESEKTPKSFSPESCLSLLNKANSISNGKRESKINDLLTAITGEYTKVTEKLRLLTQAVEAAAKQYGKTDTWIALEQQIALAYIESEKLRPLQSQLTSLQTEWIKFKKEIEKQVENHHFDLVQFVSAHEGKKKPELISKWHEILDPSPVVKLPELATEKAVIENTPGKVSESITAPKILVEGKKPLPQIESKDPVTFSPVKTRDLTAKQIENIQNQKVGLIQYECSDLEEKRPLSHSIPSSVSSGQEPERSQSSTTPVLTDIEPEQEVSTIRVPDELQTSYFTTASTIKNCDELNENIKSLKRRVDDEFKKITNLILQATLSMTSDLQLNLSTRELYYLPRDIIEQTGSTEKSLKRVIETATEGLKPLYLSTQKLSSDITSLTQSIESEDKKLNELKYAIVKGIKETLEEYCSEYNFASLSGKLDAIHKESPDFKFNVVMNKSGEGLVFNNEDNLNKMTLSKLINLANKVLEHTSNKKTRAVWSNSDNFDGSFKKHISISSHLTITGTQVSLSLSSKDNFLSQRDQNIPGRKHVEKLQELNRTVERANCETLLADQKSIIESATKTIAALPIDVRAAYSANKKAILDKEEEFKQADNALDTAVGLLKNELKNPTENIERLLANIIECHTTLNQIKLKLEAFFSENDKEETSLSKTKAYEDFKSKINAAQCTEKLAEAAKLKETAIEANNSRIEAERARLAAEEQKRAENEWKEYKEINLQTPSLAFQKQIRAQEIRQYQVIRKKRDIAFEKAAEKAASVAHIETTKTANAIDNLLDIFNEVFCDENIKTFWNKQVSSAGKLRAYIDGARIEVNGEKYSVPRGVYFARVAIDALKEHSNYDLELKSINNFDELARNKPKKPCLYRDINNQYKMWGLVDNKWQFRDIPSLPSEFKWTEDKTIHVNHKDILSATLRVGHIQPIPSDRKIAAARLACLSMKNRCRTIEDESKKRPTDLFYAVASKLFTLVKKGYDFIVTQPVVDNFLELIINEEKFNPLIKTKRLKELNLARELRDNAEQEQRNKPLIQNEIKMP